MIIGFILAGSLPSSGSGKGLRTPKNWFVKPRHWSPRTITHFLSARLPACTATELKGTYRCIMCGVRLLLFYVCCTNLGLVWLPYACSVLCFSTASRRNSCNFNSFTYVDRRKNVIIIKPLHKGRGNSSDKLERLYPLWRPSTDWWRFVRRVATWPVLMTKEKKNSLAEKDSHRYSVLKITLFKILRMLVWSSV